GSVGESESRLNFAKNRVAFAFRHHRLSICAAAMTEYVAVSGGVVSGIGKGVIGTPCPRSSSCTVQPVPTSLFDRSAAQGDRSQGHYDQNRPLHERRCGHDASDGAR
ncbi:hypothetical protein FA95DRAFT_531227, partial [Auriscalpium vulgare]